MKFIGSLGSSTIHSSVSNLRKISLHLTSRDKFIALQINDAFVVSDTFFFNRYLSEHQKKLLTVYAELEEIPQSENINNNVFQKAEVKQYVAFTEGFEGGEPSITFHIPIKSGQAEEITRYLCAETFEVEFSFYLDDVISRSGIQEFSDGAGGCLWAENIWHTGPDMPQIAQIRSFSICLCNFSQSKLSLLESVKLNDGLTESSIRHFEKIGNLSSNEKQVFLLDRIFALSREIRHFLFLIALLLLASIFF
jgi:hypothetical protein